MKQLVVLVSAATFVYAFQRGHDLNLRSADMALFRTPRISGLLPRESSFRKTDSYLHKRQSHSSGIIEPRGGRARSRSPKRSGSQSPDRQARPDARVRVDTFGRGAQANALPYYSSTVPASAPITGPQDWAAGHHVSATSRQWHNDQRISIDGVGKKVTGSAETGPLGSAVLQATGAHGTDTKIIGGSMQSSARVSAESGWTGQPAHVSIKATGQGSTAVRATASEHDPMPNTASR